MDGWAIFNEVPIAFTPMDPSCFHVAESRAVLEYWDHARGASFAPRWKDDFRLIDLPAPVLKNLTVVDVIDGGKNYQYRYVGTGCGRAKGYDMTRKLLTESPCNASVETGYQHYNWVVESRRPMVANFIPRFAKKASEGLVSYRFPMTSDGRSVDKIVTFQPLDLCSEMWEQAYTAMIAQEMDPPSGPVPLNITLV